MYTSRDASARLQLIDFGFARRVDLKKQYDEIGECFVDSAY